jgi:WD40 repeat protein
VWDAHSGELVRSWAAHYRRCAAIRFSDDDTLVLTGGDDAIVNCWSLAQLVHSPLVGRVHRTPRDVSPIRSSAAHALPVTDLVVRNGALAHVYSASLDRTVKLWHLESDSIVLSVVLPSAIHCLALSPDAATLYAGLESGVIQVVAVAAPDDDTATAPVDGADGAETVDATAARGVAALLGHDGPVTSVALSLDGTLLVSGSRDATVRVWDTGSGQTVRTHTARATPFVAAASTVCAVRVLLRPRDDIALTMQAQSGPMAHEVANLRKYRNESALPALHDAASLIEFQIDNRVENEPDERAELSILDDDEVQHQAMLQLTASRVALYSNVAESTTERIERLEAELVEARNDARRWRQSATEMFEFMNADHH